MDQSFIPQQTTTLNVIPLDKLIRVVLQIIGAPEDDNEARQLALDALDESADELHLGGQFYFNRKEQTYSAGVDYSDGDAHLDLPTDFAFPAARLRVNNVSGNLLNLATWVAWERFDNMIIDADRQGPTGACSIRSTQDEVFYVYPNLDTSSVGSIVLPYFAAVERPSEATTFTVPREIEHALKAGARAYIMRHRHSTNPNIYLPFQRDAAIARLRASQLDVLRHGPLTYQFVPNEKGLEVDAPYAHIAYDRPGTVYISI